MALFGFNFGKSDSEQQSNSGVIGNDKNILSNWAAPKATAVGDFGFNRLMSPVPTFNVGRYGLGSQFDTAIDTIGSNMFGKASSTAGARGFLSPENLGGVVGSAVRQAAPQLAPFADSAAKLSYFGPEQIMSQRYNDINSLFTTIAQLLGSHGSGSSSAFNFGMQTGSGGSMGPSGSFI